MSNLLPACFIIAAFTLIGAAAIQRDDSAADAQELNSEPLTVKNLYVVRDRKNLGSWKDAVPNLSGWIEVDPATGRPLISNLPQATNLKAKPQRLTEKADI